MPQITRRRLRNTALTLAGLAIVWLWVHREQQSLRETSFTTGYLLLATIAVLALYNLRKKLPFLPLGSASVWLQWHLYLGMGSVGLVALHAGPHWPRGMLDGILSSVYLLTIFSGVVGLYLTRTIPGQLSRVGNEVVYERIPTYRRQIREQADKLVLESVSASGATTLAEFYVQRLFEFFRGSRGPGYTLRPSTVRRRALMREMSDLDRYLSAPERRTAERLYALVRQTDDLDFHEARQKLLKIWLFVHIGLTYALVLLVALHALVAHAYDGGAA